MASTLQTYRSQLHHFIDWTGEANASSIVDLDRELAEDYLHHLRQRGLRIPGRWSTLRGFGRWLVQTERLLQSPFEDIVLGRRFTASRLRS
ncbi:MAG: site-specific integrase [Myxococcota bacterium]